MQINQQAIARKLKISTATVSRSLRNSPEIHPETRAQVIDMARKMGYSLPTLRMDKQPAQAAKEVTSLGLLIQSDDHVDSGKAAQHTMMVLAGVCESVRSLHASITVHHVPLVDREKIADREFQPAALQQNLLAGIVLHHYFRPDVIARLGRQVPCVAISHDYPEQGVDCVDLDAAHAVAMLMDRLYQLGHRRIGFISELNYQSWSQARYAGYLQSLVRLRLPFDPAIADTQIDHATITPEQIEQIISQTKSGVTAWVTASDTVACAWYRILTQRGLRVPEDVSIVGFGVEETPANMKPLTSIRIPFDEMGKCAVRLLMDRIREPVSPIRRLCLKGQLFDGQTVARPAVRSFWPEVDSHQ